MKTINFALQLFMYKEDIFTIYNMSTRMIKNELLLLQIISLLRMFFLTKLGKRPNNAQFPNENRTLMFEEQIILLCLNLSQ